MSKTTNYWNKVYDLLDTVEDRYYPRFLARGTVLLENWGEAFKQVVEMMYYSEVLGDPSRKDPARAIASVAREVKATNELIEAILGERDAL